ncbi:MAG TPA: 3-oxoacyl-ACP reductase family protein [Desulfuromonadales bacterium]|nr:3-oxoacyl-ACP reductase family protein [Desulfuromonadales bacterium]
MNLKDKIAIITGAGRGIGRAIALAMAEHGADCVIADIDEINAASVSKEVKTLGRSSLAMKVDVADQDDVCRLIERCRSEFKRIDIFVNNAGVSSPLPLLETSPEEFNRQIDINLKGVFYGCKAVFPTMMEQGSGKIINIASIAGKRGGGIMGRSAYAASKGGVIAFTKAVAREGGPYHINVNAIAPGLTATEMTAQFTGEQREAVVKSIPLGRVGLPEDVAKAAVFLASDYADFITGEIMDVDGGFMMD